MKIDYLKILKKLINSSAYKLQKRNIYLKGDKRVILGEMGFKNEIENFKEDASLRENTLYYPNEYFLSDWSKEIKLSFDIW
jgi:hypothetical protein